MSKAWQARMISLGLCRSCGKDKGAERSARRNCLACEVRERTYERRRTGQTMRKKLWRVKNDRD